MILSYSHTKICQPLTKRGDWQTGNLRLAGDRKARFLIANTGGGHSTALRVYDRMDEVVESPILTFTVIEERLKGMRVETEDKDTLYLFHSHKNSDALPQQEIDILGDIVEGEETILCHE